MTEASSSNRRFRLPPFVVRFLVPAAVLLALIGLAYWQAPSAVFYFDDHPDILNNAHVRITELTPGNLLRAGRYSTEPRRPLPAMTFAVDWWRGGGDPRPFHWTNLILHGAAALSVFGLLALVLGRLGRRSGTTQLAALFGAALWACHPIQVQAVTYAMQRMTSMAALFTVLTVVFYLAGRSTERPARRSGFFLLTGLALLLALGSKENAAVAPVLILLAEYGVLRHGRAIVRTRLDLALLCLPVLLLIYVALDVLTGSGPLAETFLPRYEGRDFTLAERLLTQPRVIGFHLSQILWPLPGRFSLEHDVTLSSGLLSPPSTALALAGVVLWCAAGVWALFRARWRIVGFFLLWVPATLAIEATFVPLEMIFEHRMYLPSVGLAGLGAVAVARLLEMSSRVRLPALAVLVAMVALLSLSTALRVPLWGSELSLARDSLEHAPNSARAWANLGNAYKNQGRWDEAEPAIRKALELDPDHPTALHMLAQRLIDRGRLDEAEQIVQRLMIAGPPDHRVVNTVGRLRFEQNDSAEAIRYFRLAVLQHASLPGYRWNLALAYERSGACAEARQQWLAFLRLERQAPTKVRMVRDRLRTNFDSEGGACFRGGG